MGVLAAGQIVKWADCQYKSDMDDILDMATGANTSYMDLRAFLCAADEQGTDLPFVREFAKLCRLADDGKLSGGEMAATTVSTHSTEEN